MTLGAVAQASIPTRRRPLNLGHFKFKHRSTVVSCQRRKFRGTLAAFHSNFRLSAHYRVPRDSRTINCKAACLPERPGSGIDQFPLSTPEAEQAAR